MNNRNKIISVALIGCLVISVLFVGIELQNRFDRHDSLIASLTEQTETYERDIEQLYSDVQNLTIDLETKGNTILELENEKQELLEEIDSLNEDIQDKKDELKELEGIIESKDDEISDINLKILALQSLIDSLEQDIEELDTKYEALEQAYENVESEIVNSNITKVSLIENMNFDSIEDRYVIYLGTKDCSKIVIYWNLENSLTSNGLVFRFRFVENSLNLSTGSFLFYDESESPSFTQLTDKNDVIVTGPGHLTLNANYDCFQIFIYEFSTQFEENEIDVLNAILIE